MKKSAMALAVLAGIMGVGQANSASTDERLQAMEKRLQYLEQRVASQDQVILEKDRQIASLTNNGTGGWFQSVSLGGTVEVEAQSVSPSNGSDTSDLYVSTVELAIAAQVNDWTEAEVVLLYEDDGTHSGEIDVDTATIRIADPDANWFVTTGQYALPFGNYATNLVSDPITLDAAETSDVAVEVGFESDGFIASAYLFKGEQQSKIENGGLNLGYETETDNFGFAGGIGWINDIGESNAVVDNGTSQTNRASAWTLFAQLTAGDFTFIGEYVAATEPLDAYSTTDEPSFFNLEAAYGFHAMGRPATVAISYQGSDEASAYAGGMDEERKLAAFSVEIMDNTHLSLEYVNAEDYSGADTDTVTGKVAVEF